MALIKCPKCGETISDNVVICPNCNALLNNNPTTNENPNKYSLGCGFVALIIAIAALIFGFWTFSIGGIIFVLLGIFVFGVACSLFNDFRKAVYKQKLSKTDYAAYKEYVEHEQQKEKEMQDFLQQQKDEKNAKKDEKNAKKYNNYKYKCPMCNSNKVMNISTTKKVVSAELMGLASNKIGKTYQCDECKYMW